MQPVTVIGSYLSPYVRKVLVALELKQIPYRIDPIVPFYGNEEFSRLSPLRRIPVLIDDEVVLSDSTVICEYLEDRWPTPALYPATPAERGRARWLEEFADSRMGEVFIWRYFNQLVIRRAVWGEKPDQEVVQKAINEEIPQILDYLEDLLPADGFLFADAAMTVADIAIAAMLRNAEFARFSIDAGRWPVSAAFIGRVLATEPFAGLRGFEDVLMRTPIDQVRAALQQAGAPLTETSLARAEPERGIMSI